MTPDEMNDDELIDRLRRTLRDEAAQVHAPPDAWDRFQRRSAPRQRSRWLTAAPIGVVGIAAAIVAAVLVSSSGGRKTEIHAAAGAATTAGPATTAAASAAVPAPSTPPGGQSASAAIPAPGLAGFQARSATFVSPTEGFVLGTASIAHTIDGGRTWKALPAPADTKVSELRFADAHNGWAWGPDLWATHDGGSTWHQLTVPGGEGGVYELEAAAGTVHMVVFDGQAFRVATAPVASDVFALALGAASIPVGGGPVPTIQLVLQGRTGWIVEVDRTVVGGLTLVNGTWQPWSPPCLDVNGPAYLAASSASELVAVCDEGVWGAAPHTGRRLLASHDGGRSFTDVGAVPVDQVGAVASPSPATVVAAGTTLQATFDGGRTWSSVLQPAAGQQVTDLGFTTTMQGVLVLHAPGQAGLLVTSADGGRTWHGVRFS